MVQHLINLDERQDRVLNIIKAKFGLKNKSQAIAMVTQIYEDSFLEPELRPEFITEMKKVKKQKGIPFKNIDELRKIIEG